MPFSRIENPCWPALDILGAAQSMIHQRTFEACCNIPACVKRYMPQCHADCRRILAGGKV
jgi:hypothetical protein